MEPISFIPITLASVMASFSADNSNVEQAVISTHTSPEIAGIWELDLQAIPDFAQPDAQQQFGITSASSEQQTAKEKDLQQLILAIQEVNKTEQERADKQEVQDKYIQDKSAQTSNTQASSGTDLNRFDSNQKIIPMQAGSSPVAPKPVASKPVAQCKERYSFGADNIMVTTSGEEWTYGRYMYQHQNQGLPIIAITTQYDNNKMDCSGQQIDQTGETLLAFVDYQPENNLMRWCIDPEGKNCFMTLHKLVP
ncbi:hypothetical protein [Psychrobacter lutiphocae]|uniref:hypothetical protein n=1 Tax=Psychrobacter lutiphocae TaxID=540500 RepID=UPI00036682ED|nr:hypothetical protein [Psychrobacter lutiphocae]